jgi:hypothetical protein
MKTIPKVLFQSAFICVYLRLKRMVSDQSRFSASSYAPRTRIRGGALGRFVKLAPTSAGFAAAWREDRRFY